MTMKFKRIQLIIIVLLMTSFFACKKYEEGPIISLRTKMHRIAGSKEDHKQWDVEYFSVDGVDSTGFLRNKPQYGKYIFSAKDQEGNCEYVYQSNSTTYREWGKWNFIDKKNNLEIYYYPKPNTTPFSVGAYNATYQVWEIQRLTEKDLWLKCTYQNKEYYVKFKRSRN